MTRLSRIDPAGIGGLALVLDLVPVATLLLDRQALRLVAGNAEAARLFGCAPERLAQVWLAVLATAAGDRLRDRFGGMTGGDHPAVFDLDIAPPGAAQRAVLVRARVVEAAGQTLVSAALVDITRRRQAEARLATAHRRLEVALDGAELGAWHWDARTGLVEVSARWAGMVGLDPVPRTLSIEQWHALVHPEDLPRLQAIVRDHLRGDHGRFEAEFRMRHRDGHWVPVLSRGEALERDAAGRAQVMTGTHRDLTNQREAAAAHAASERKARRRLAELETLYRSAPLGLAQIDRDLRFVRINEALADINGFPVEAHLGRSAWDLVPDLREAAEPLLRRVVEQGEIITGIEFSGETAKAPGVKRDWVEQFYPVRDPETEEVTGIGIVCEEVTERKRADRTRELLLRELDHRVKNLFAIVSGLVSFSARGAATPAAMREALLGRIGALARAHDLVRPAIAGDSGAAPDTTVPSLLEALLAPFAGGDGLPERLCLHGPALPLGPVAAPPIALALHELATNAAKYGALSQPGGTVAVDWAPEGGLLRLRWMEAGGPALQAPTRSGFGHRLVTQSAAQLGGTARLDWSGEGLLVELLLPLDRLRT